MTSPFNQWTSAHSNAAFSDPKECAKRAGRFELQIRFRNILEYAAGALVVFLFGGFAVLSYIKGEYILALSGVLTVLGAFVLLWNLHRRASNLERRPEDACLVHLRRQYQHQYDALSSIASWYIGPLMPGIIVFCIGITASMAEVLGWQQAIADMMWLYASMLAILGFVLAANWFAARHLKMKIREMDALG